eukprot:356552-Chlamydomonas_euryale.AAC.1
MSVRRSWIRSARPGGQVVSAGEEWWGGASALLMRVKLLLLFCVCTGTVIRLCDETPIHALSTQGNVAFPVSRNQSEGGEGCSEVTRVRGGGCSAVTRVRGGGRLFSSDQSEGGEGCSAVTRVRGVWGRLSSSDPRLLLPSPLPTLPTPLPPSLPPPRHLASLPPFSPSQARTVNVSVDAACAAALAASWRRPRLAHPSCGGKRQCGSLVVWKSAL